MRRAPRWTPKLAAARCDRRIDALIRRCKKQLECVANEWSDEDDILERETHSVLERITDDLRAYKVEMREHIAAAESERAERGKA